MRRTSRRGGLFSLLVVASCALCIGLAEGQTYSVDDLGPLIDVPGRTDSGPHAINDAGSVVGANAVGGFYQALLYRSSWTDLGTLGGSESLAGGLNDSAQVVGYSQTGAAGTNAFLWTPGATGGVAGNPQMQSLGTLGGPVSEAYAINASGQVTGYSDAPAHPATQQHAFLYSAGAMTDLGQQLSGLVNSYGYGINTEGHVVGAAYDVSYTTPHPFFFDGSTTQDLGVFGGLGATAQAINKWDNIAGYLTTTSSFDHAFSYSSGTVTDLGTLGGHYSYALGMNNSNAIVGGSFTDIKDSIYHAFVCNNGKMVDLNGLLDASGAGWTLSEARAINDVGQITGVGVLNGANHTFRLTPLITANAPPQIKSIQTSGSDVIVRFTTIAARSYALQTNGALSTKDWGNLVTNIPGNGGTVVVTNFGGIGASRRFYRVMLSP